MPFSSVLWAALLALSLLGLWSEQAGARGRGSGVVASVRIGAAHRAPAIVAINRKIVVAPGQIVVTPITPVIALQRARTTRAIIFPTAPVVAEERFLVIPFSSVVAPSTSLIVPPLMSPSLLAASPPVIRSRFNEPRNPMRDVFTVEQTASGVIIVRGSVVR